MKKKNNNWRDAQEENLIKIKRSKFKGLTPNQDKCIRTIEDSIITLIQGPAGSGKSYLTCGIAARLLSENKIDKIIITRPLVACGSKGFGFLPGDMDEKISPFMRPIMDLFNEFFDEKEIQNYIDLGRIELIPLEVMRGLTFKRSYIILDEAENAEYNQLYMLLTRIGENSKIVITGDVKQSDLTISNPFLEIIKRFSNNCHKDISLVKLESEDIVRHPLISWIDNKLSEENTSTYIPKVQSGTWRDFFCPYKDCEAINWYNNGDESDENGVDVETVTCWKCVRCAIAPQWAGEEWQRGGNKESDCFGHRQPE